MTDDEIEKIAHRQASVYKHRSDPSECSYGFMRHTLIDFARAIVAAHEAKKQQDHLTSDAVVRTEPGEESALGVQEDEEWEHPCPFRGEPTMTPNGKACTACGLREQDINDDAVGVPASVANVAPAAAPRTRGTAAPRFACVSKALCIGYPPCTTHCRHAAAGLAPTDGEQR